MRLAKIGLIGIVSVLFAGAVPAEDSTVVLGGAGPSPYFEGAIDKIADALTQAGIKVRVLSGGARSRTALLDVRG
jgi:hypothetical protein